MAVPVYEEITFFYEVLMRFSDQAPNRGKLSGALLRTITITTKDGSVIAAQENPPEQLALVDGEDGQKLSDVLGEVNAATIIENQNLTAALAEARNGAQELSSQLADTENMLNEARQSLTEANEEIQRLMALIPQPLQTADDSAPTASEPSEV